MAEQRLTQKGKELIAVGAAVSAGCQKCADYHFKQAFVEGATKEQVHGAVLEATFVIKSSNEIMQRKAYSLMDIDREEYSESDTNEKNRLTVLIKVAAAVASSNTNNITGYLAMAASMGASHGEMKVAAKLGKAILKKAGEFADEAMDEGLISPV